MQSVDSKSSRPSSTHRKPRRRVQRFRVVCLYGIETLETRRLLSGGDIPPVPTPAGHWTFDEGAGATAADLSGNGHTATLGTGASWVSGNVGTAAMTVNGGSTAFANVTGPVVDTSSSFTVSAWINLSQLGGYQTVVSTAGTTVAGFYLQLRGDTGTFGFARLASDANGSAAVAASSSPPVTGTWYHIVGVDDVSAGTLSLYVDGQLEGTASYAGGWQANGNTLIGHGFYNGGLTDRVYGSIDEVAMFDSALTGAQIAALDHPAAYPFEEGSGSTTADVSGHGNTLTLNAGASWTAGHTSEFALSVDGTTSGNATIASSVLDTSQPFSVGAWVKLNDLSGFQTFVSIDGANTSGFYLQLRGDSGRFAFTRLASDNNNAQVYRANATAAPVAGTWYHLLGVNDVANGRIQLYVNGVLQSSTNAPTGWQATGATVIGGGKFNGNRVDAVDGTIDDVRFFNSPLSATAAAVAPYIGGPTVLNIATATTGVTVSPDLFGLFMEDINYGGDGGVYSDQVRNGGFNDATNNLNAWAAVTGSGVSAALTTDAGTGVSTALPKSGKLTIASGVSAANRVGISNAGYFGMAVAPSTTYDVEFWAKATAGFTGPLTVTLESNAGIVYASAVIPAITTSWTKYTTTLTTNAAAPTSSTNKFIIATNDPSANGQSIWLGSAHLFPPSFNDSPAHLRVDLMEKLDAMNAAFFRVPGGNYLEGNDYANRVKWWETIGPLENRPGHMNPWGYWSTDGMGLDEYLQMSELVGARPLLAVFAGYTLNGQSSTGAQLTQDVQDALNELHYVLDPVTTSWGALRAANGHPEPYDVREVEIGNEDWFSSTYGARYPLFYDAIRAEFPQLKIIATHTDTGGRPYDMLDEHFYNSASWFQGSQNHYDSHSGRGSFEVIVGEYAAREGAPTSNMGAALGDATFLIGTMENSDLVTMTCYAPIWANVNGVQWNTDLIGFNNTSSYGSASYYAQVMLANNHGSTVISNSMIGGSGLRTVVTRTGSTYYLTVINVSAAAKTTTVGLSGVSNVSPMATMMRMQAASSTTVNSIANPTAIVPVTSLVTGLDTSFTHEFPAYSMTILKFTAGNVAPAPTTAVGAFDVDAAQQQIQYTFSSDITELSIDASDLLIQNLDNSAIIPSASILAAASGNTATFSFQNLPGAILPDGNYRATLSGGGVFNSAGYAMDGDGNGTSEGDHVFDFFFLHGDADANRKVDTRDFNLLAGSFGSTGSFSEGNFNYDGVVDSIDFGILLSQYGKSLPAPAGSLSITAPAAPIFGEQDILDGDGVDELP